MKYFINGNLFQDLHRLKVKKIYKYPTPPPCFYQLIKLCGFPPTTKILFFYTNSEGFFGGKIQKESVGLSLSVAFSLSLSLSLCEKSFSFPKRS